MQALRNHIFHTMLFISLKDKSSVQYHKSGKSARIFIFDIYSIIYM